MCNEYTAYTNMKQRCYNKNNPHYKYYGARGVIVCKRWLKSSKNFLNDMGKCPEGLTLDRIDNDGDYNPRNCRWATWKEQFSSRRKRSKKPLYLSKTIVRLKTDKLRTRYNHSVINLHTGQVHNNQHDLAKSLNVSRQAVSFYFKGLSRKLKGCNYMFYKDYLINRWRGFNILFKWRTI